MISYKVALENVLENVDKLETEMISIFESVGRVMAAKAVSIRDLPPLDNSAMDGYAVIHSDIKSYPQSLKVVGNIAAGDDISECNLTQGNAYRIMTGAFVPKGADTVIPHELTDNNKEIVSIVKEIKKGANIRAKASDISTGEEIDFIGEVITAYHIARLVSAGVFYVKVYRKVNIAIISTGDEIASLNNLTDPLKTFDSNGVSMKYLLQTPATDVEYLGVFPDDIDQLLSVFSRLERYDIVVTSAGISVGDFDLMHVIAERLNIRWKFNKIDQKPGAHFAFGMLNNSYLFACPGNPVSSLFCAYFYILPAVYKISGRKKFHHAPIKAKLSTSIFKKKSRVEFDRVKLSIQDSEILATPLTSQDSYKISSLIKSDAFAVFGDDLVGEIPKGSLVDCYIFNYETFLHS